MSKGIFIDGAWCAAKGDVFTSTDPSDDREIWRGQAASGQDVARAYEAARRAFEPWAEMSLEARLEIIGEFKKIALANKEKLAQLIARETGKVLWDATGEAGAVAGKVDVSTKAYHERTGQSSTPVAFGRADLRHRPHGVMAVLGPYNFPAHLPNGQIIPALIAGNTVVYKPSELCPAVGEFMMDLYAQAGFPAGVINMVQGARDTGAAVLDSDVLDGVLFTGSAGTGAFIHRKFGGRPEIVLALEMGGNNPLMLWDVQDAQAAASIIVQSAFITSGQRCTCARRILLPRGPEGDRVLEAVLAMTDSIVVGAWDDEPAPFMGPLVSSAIATQVVERANALTGKVLRPTQIMDRGGAFVKPGIIDVTGETNPDEEIFGPVMQIHRFDQFKDGIAEANNTRFGLSAGLISDDPKNWDIFTHKIRAGVVNFNRPTTGAAGFLPFGGPGLSGNHNPGAFYAADFCAWPMASQISETVENMPAQGLSTC